MTVASRSPVTVLGLGAMGRALAGAFLNNGHPTTVWNRTEGKSAELAGRGATVATTVADAIAASPIVVICVLDYDAVNDVLRVFGASGIPGPPAGILAGRTLVNLTNGTPRQAHEMARWAATHGADYLDGGIMAVPPMIGSPASLVLYSGSPEVFTAHERTLAALGTSTHLGADVGRASLYDIALLSAMYGMFGGFLHAVAMVNSEKVPATEFTPLVVSWLTAMITTLPAMAKAVDSGDHSAADSNLRMQALAYVNLLEASRDQGVSTELMEPMRALLNRAVTANRGDGDLSGLIDLVHTSPVRNLGR